MTLRAGTAPPYRTNEGDNRDRVQLHGHGHARHDRWGLRQLCELLQMFGKFSLFSEQIVSSPCKFNISLKMRFTCNVVVDYSEFGGNEVFVGSSRDPWSCRAPCSALASDPRQSSKVMGIWPSAGGREDGRARRTCRGQDADGDDRATAGLRSISVERQKSSRSRSILLRQLTVDVTTAPTSRAALRAPARWTGPGTRTQQVLISRSRPWRRGSGPQSRRGGQRRLTLGGTVDEIPSTPWASIGR
jgi:hypothetical protein